MKKILQNYQKKKTKVNRFKENIILTFNKNVMMQQAKKRTVGLIVLSMPVRANYRF